MAPAFWRRTRSVTAFMTVRTAVMRPTAVSWRCVRHKTMTPGRSCSTEAYNLEFFNSAPVPIWGMMQQKLFTFGKTLHWMCTKLEKFDLLSKCSSSQYSLLWTYIPKQKCVKMMLCLPCFHHEFKGFVYKLLSLKQRRVLSLFNSAKTTIALIWFS